MLRTPFKWSDQNVAVLRDMLTKGHSASQVASRIGTTKNSCVGKALRLGLSFKTGTVIARIDARLEERRATRASSLWTEDEVSKAARLWSEGKTAGQIAFEIGKTVSAVGNKIQDNRDLFPFRNRASGLHAENASTTTTIANRVARERKVANGYPDEPPDQDFDASVFEITSSILTPVSRRLQLTELSERTCKWPIGDPLKEGFVFCGTSSRNGSPYCGFHNRIAYRHREAINIGGWHK